MRGGCQGDVGVEWRFEGVLGRVALKLYIGLQGGIVLWKMAPGLFVDFKKNYNQVRPKWCVA